MRRVVVTGMAGITSLGSEWDQIRTAMAAGRTGIQRLAEWDKYEELNTRLAGPVEGFSVVGKYPRKKLRSMGRVAQLAVVASEAALADAGLLEDPVVQSGRLGVAYGSSFGSTEPVRAFAHFMDTGKTGDITATSYVRMMSHTAAVNLGVFFGAQGRIIPTSSACTAGSQGIGYAFEAIRYGRQDVMIAGGAEEQCPTMTAVFDTLYATSVKNDSPDKTPRPYDKDRDGLVIGEGAGTLILEEYEHAKARGATIHAEIVGFATNSDGVHVTQPTAATMEACMRQALLDADIEADTVDFISGHGTATQTGDAFEIMATKAVMQREKPIHSLKSYFGHTLGACGALEAWLGIRMMNEGWFAGTANLDTIDPDCEGMDHIVGAGASIDCRYFMSNNFAFGGINTSLIFKALS